MSFDAIETSLASRKPVRLYAFEMGALKWYYTQAPVNVTAGGIEYTSVRGLDDNGIRQTGETSADMLSITAPVDLYIAQLFNGVPASNQLTLAIREVHLSDPDLEVQTRWVGIVKSVRRRGVDRAEIKATPLYADLEKTGLRLSWGRNCPHALYDGMCNVPKLAFREEGVIQAMDGASISSGVLGTHGDGWFSGGFVEWEIGLGVLERRGIDQQVGSTATLLGGTSGLVLGLQIFPYPGCNRTTTHCNEKFDNMPNYGGIPHLPGQSPFDGEPLY